MRRQIPVAHLLYGYLYPHPTATDPPSFPAHLAKNLVPEVRIEVATFYGDLNSAEARYPGLNYCHPPHRMRLGRFKHHKRLFDAFDALGLTYTEIQDFCCWEGTKWARERYEKDEGVKVLDTTGDEIGPFVDRRAHRSEESLRWSSITRKTDISVTIETRQPPSQENDEEKDDLLEEHREDGHEDVAMDPDGADTRAENESPSEAAARLAHIAELTYRRDRSITQQFNQRILAAWENGSQLPPEIEQYLKEQSEHGNSDLSRLLSQRRSPQRGGASEAALVTASSPRAAA